MKLEKLELSALLGMQARHRELIFVREQANLQLQKLEDESKEFFSDIEVRLNMTIDSFSNYDVDTETGELIPKPKGDPLTNGHNEFSDVTVLEGVD